MNTPCVNAAHIARGLLARQVLAILRSIPGLLMCVLVPCLTTHQSAAEPLVAHETDVARVMQVVVSMKESPEDFSNAAYYSELLELVLNKTITSHGPYELKREPMISIENRLLREIELGRIDLTWMPYQQNPGHKLRPIPVPLLKNLSDYRVFLIRPDDQARFTAVKNLEDLRQLRGGVGTHWPDRAIMEFNHLPLVLSVSYQGLFRMLVAGRFDYFSRGIYQALPEVTRYPDIELALEKELLLYYESPVYFFVREDNHLLAQRLELGLRMAIADGSFDALFNGFPRLVWAEEQLASKQRRIIALEKP